MKKHTNLFQVGVGAMLVSLGGLMVACDPEDPTVPNNDEPADQPVPEPDPMDLDEMNGDGDGGDEFGDDLGN